MIRTLELAPPVVSEGQARFAWSVTPAISLYERCHFTLRFPSTVDIERVPEELWWRVALLCLHPHWPLLRPCRVVLPVRLPTGETEFWLRLTDAAVASLEAATDGHDTRRAIELVGSGPIIGPPRAGIGAPPDPPGTVSCFSGGRDSLTQAALLSELGLPPLLVTVTSPGAWSVEHETERRSQVLRAITERRRLELCEVRSDLRANWNNDFAGPRYAMGVNELTDCLLYLAAAIVVASARGAARVMMASEAEIQENARRRGMVVQLRHFMYSAVTHRAISELLDPAGIEVGSTTNALQQFQVQRLLSERYDDLRDLQYSCWELTPEQSACSRCPECRRIALNLAAAGVSPRAAGIDLGELLLAHAHWHPGERTLKTPTTDPLPGPRVSREHEMQELRCLAGTPAERVAQLIDGHRSEPERRRALEIYSRLRAEALSYELAPEPGYRRGYLGLLGDGLGDGLDGIFGQHFTPAPETSYEETLANTRLLADWITAPLADSGVTPRSSEGQESEPLGHLIPDPEPALRPGDDGRILRVAETLLDGHEDSYVNQALRENWISSAGPFVSRFEAAFAEAMGCRYAVACSSGTAALHLAVAACGISTGDEVIVPAFTMIATANAARYVGAEPVLVDADPASWNLDPDRLRDKLTPRTRAVIAVHTYGQPAEMDAIRRFAADNGLAVIEDAAEAHGARFHGRAVGSLGDVAAFSLYGNKILSTGEGGVLTTNDSGIADLARELRDHAFSRERHFWHRRVGFNYRMTNLQAAVGLAQTERLTELVELRLEVGRRYRELLSDIDGLELPPLIEGGVMWMFGIRVTEAFGIGRDELRRRLAGRGVETRTFFVPLHLQPIYRNRFAGQRYPVAETLGRTGLYLPSGPGLSADDLSYVASAIREAAVRALDRAPGSA